MVPQLWNGRSSEGERQDDDVGGAEKEKKSGKAST